MSNSHEKMMCKIEDAIDELVESVKTAAYDDGYREGFDAGQSSVEKEPQ